MASALRHNKKRNTGLVYEFLVRKISAAMIEKDETSQKESIALLKKYFAPGKVLAEELSVFTQIIPTRGLSERAASNLINESRDFVKDLDRDSLDREKGKLLGEINRKFGKSFFDRFRIDEYRLYATLGMLIEKWGRSSLQESKDRARLEEVLVRHMSTIQDNEEQLPTDRLVYSIALRKLDEKYGTTLSPGQKKILREYVASSFNEDRDFMKFAQKERARIIETVDVYRTSLKKDKMMIERVDAARDRLKNLDMSSGEDLVEELMLFVQLEEEIGTDG